MFGLGKSRKIRDGYIQQCSVILGTYKLARTLGQHIIDESGLDEFGSKLYEATYLLGVFDSVAQAIDQEGKYLTQDFILEAANHCLVGYEIFPEDEVEGIMSFPVLAQNKPAIISLQVAGGEAARKCIDAILDGEDVAGGAFKAMSLDYFKDKKQLKDFKKFFEDYIKNPNKSK